MKIVFQNQCKKTGKFIKEIIDLSNEPTVKDYLKKANLRNYLKHVANIVKSDKKCGYDVQVFSEYLRHKQWVYILVIAGCVVKIGDSTMTLQGRWNSYSAGTRENRDRGTCSTTNYFISEIIRVSLNMGLKVELYGYTIPNQYQTIDVFGDKQDSLADFVKIFEGNLIKKFNTIYNKLPIVGKNGMEK
jgi:hypothetical protein